MKIGTFFDRIDLATDNGEVKCIQEAFDRLVPMGLSFVDVSSGVFGEKYEPVSLQKILKENGVYAGSMFHLFPFDYKKENIIEASREDIELQLERCAQLECKLFMPVPRIMQNHKDAKERMHCREIVIQYFSEVSQCAKKYGITTIVENFSNVDCPFSTIEDFHYIFKQVPSLFYALDTGNFWFGGTDVLKAVPQFVNITEHVHLKDILPREKNDIRKDGKKHDGVALGEGVIPLDEILNELTQNGYDKTLTIEINHNEDLLNKIIRSVNFLKSRGVC
ncbi:MAG: sugar phosphate isomerase/epimerase [Clostridia bacterium]|nr:sugar phosphate isomerase/epimerase [Clostridia bacterium]